MEEEEVSWLVEGGHWGCSRWWQSGGKALPPGRFVGVLSSETGNNNDTGTEYKMESWATLIAVGFHASALRIPAGTWQVHSHLSSQACLDLQNGPGPLLSIQEVWAGLRPLRGPIIASCHHRHSRNRQYPKWTVWVLPVVLFTCVNLQHGEGLPSTSWLYSCPCQFQAASDEPSIHR